MTATCKRYLLVALAALCLLACGQTPDELTPLERATVAIIHNELDEENNAIDFYLACAGIAIGPRTILTAGHCVAPTGGRTYFADADTFLNTSNGKELGTAEQLPGDLATLTPDRDLAHWVGTAAPPAFGTVDLVRLFTGTITTEVARIDGTRVLSPPSIEHGQSGSPLGVGDRAIGVLVTCKAPDDETCNMMGGRFGVVP